MHHSITRMVWNSLERLNVGPAHSGLFWNVPSGGRVLLGCKLLTLLFINSSSVGARGDSGFEEMLWCVMALFAPWSFVGVVKGIWSQSGRPRLWPSTHAALCRRLQEALQSGCAFEGKANATSDHRMRETQETHERQRNGYPLEYRVLHGRQRCPRENEEVSTMATTTSSNDT